MTISVKEMADHVKKLLAEYKLTLKDGREGRAWHRTKTVRLSPVKSVVTYLVALHEIGHVVYPKAHNGTRLDKEYHAWQWALGRSIVRTLTPQAARTIHKSLYSYVRWARSRQHRKVPPKIPGEKHHLWKLLKLLEAVANDQAKTPD